MDPPANRTGSSSSGSIDPERSGDESTPIGWVLGGGSKRLSSKSAGAGGGPSKSTGTVLG